MGGRGSPWKVRAPKKSCWSISSVSQVPRPDGRWEIFPQGILLQPLLLRSNRGEATEAREIVEKIEGGTAKKGAEEEEGPFLILTHRRE